MVPHPRAAQFGARVGRQPYDTFLNSLEQVHVTRDSLRY